MKASEYFYSNCLFEAIKAKVKDPKNVKIHITFPIERTSIRSPFPHFWWSVGEKAYNFVTLKDRSYQVFLFKGRIEKSTVRATLAAQKLAKKQNTVGLKLKDLEEYEKEIDNATI